VDAKKLDSSAASGKTSCPTTEPIYEMERVSFTQGFLLRDYTFHFRFGMNKTRVNSTNLITGAHFSIDSRREICFRDLNVKFVIKFITYFCHIFDIFL